MASEGGYTLEEFQALEFITPRPLAGGWTVLHYTSVGASPGRQVWLNFYNEDHETLDTEGRKCGTMLDTCWNLPRRMAGVSGARTVGRCPNTTEPWAATLRGAARVEHHRINGRRLCHSVRQRFGAIQRVGHADQPDRAIESLSVSGQDGAFGWKPVLPLAGTGCRQWQPHQPKPLPHLFGSDRGPFIMGSPPNEAERYVDDETQYRVTLTRGFFMAKGTW